MNRPSSILLVLERRFADHWEAIKEIHRRHPRYDGRAGPRDQTLYFFVRTSPAPDGGYDLVAEGSLGRGSGHEKAGGGGLVLELTPARKGWFVPFDTIRIRQERPAIEGRVQETVELLSKGKGREVPFMKMPDRGVKRPPELPDHLRWGRPDVREAGSPRLPGGQGNGGRSL